MTTFPGSNVTISSTAYLLTSGEDIFVREGIYLSGATYGIQGTAGYSVVTVAGLVEGSRGVSLGGTASGSVSILETGVASGSTYGVEVQSTSTSAIRFSNDGTVIGGTRALDVNHDGIFFGSNTGVIRSDYGEAVQIVANGGAFSNFGLIEARSGNYALEIFNDVSSDAGPEFHNFGTISSFGAIALRMDFNAANTASNHGVFNGGARFGSEADTFVNRGLVNGDVTLQEGDDLYRGYGGEVDGEVRGGFGNDTLNGGHERDQLLGGEDNDVIRGFGGDDLILGEVGSDDLYGQDGDDEVYGGDGFDHIEGGRGDDLLLGEANNDRIFAGAGNDTIFGGFGRDTMFGGDGRDEFHWEGVGESGSFVNRDRVWRFEHGEDKLDFSDVTGPAINFIGTSFFSGSGPEMRAYENAFGNTILVIDATGNGSADMFVQVNGGGYTQDDFIL